MLSTGQCNKCFAINSHQATNCIDCGAPLPWAAGQPASAPAAKGPASTGPAAKGPFAAGPGATAAPSAPAGTRPGATAPGAAPVRPNAAVRAPAPTARQPVQPSPGGPSHGGPFSGGASAGGPFRGAIEDEVVEDQVDEAWANNECVRLEAAAAGVLSSVRQPKETTIVHVTADEIQWPPICACCLAAPETTYEANLATEVKIAPGATRHSWKVPSCNFCLKHSRLFDELTRLRSALMAHADEARTVQAEIERAAHANVFSKLLSASHGANQTHLDRLIAQSRKDHHAFEATCNELRQSGAGASCCFIGPAVTYVNLHNHVHEFAFRQTPYANEFRKMNRDILLGWDGLAAGRQAW